MIQDTTEKIVMQGVHVELTNAMQNAIREKFDPLLRHDERIVRINVRLHKDQVLGGERHYTATAQIELGGPDLVAHAGNKEAYTALDELVEKLDKQMQKRHGRRKVKRNHPHEIELEARLPKME